MSCQHAHPLPMPRSAAGRTAGTPNAFQALFDAIPTPAFVVDRDMRIVHWNSAAGQLVGDEPELVLLKHGGEVLNCINSEARAGCGNSSRCSDCIVRQAVTEAFDSGRIARGKSRIQVRSRTGAADLYVVATASLMQCDGELRVLLMLEDIGEIIRIQGLVPICAWCRRVRNSEQHWQALEEFVAERVSMGFTHSICGDCFHQVVPFPGKTD